MSSVKNKKTCRRIALIVQRSGEDIVGGSEGYALAMAKVLSKYFSIEIITTTAKDHETWKNEYACENSALSETLLIRRFSVDRTRESIWFELNRILMKGVPLDEFPLLTDDQRKIITEQIKQFPLGFGEEWIKREGPYSIGLLSYLAEHQLDYDYIVFMTYLYPTTYFGMDRILDKNTVYFVPTYHDEVPAYLPNFMKYRNLHHLFLTSAEKHIAEQRIYCTSVKNNIIGFGIRDRFDEVPAPADPTGDQYVLYAGRIEAAKGVHQLFAMFEKYSEENNNIKLYLIGDGVLKKHKHSNIVYKGFVNEEDKLRYMRDAVAFIHPSAFESLGIVLLESFMMGTPALVNKRSAVLNEHIVNSEAGYPYTTYEEFRDALDSMSRNRSRYDILCKNARHYFLTNYSLTAYEEKLLSIFK